MVRTQVLAFGKVSAGGDVIDQLHVFIFGELSITTCERARKALFERQTVIGCSTQDHPADESQLWSAVEDMMIRWVRDGIQALKPTNVRR
jgi:hypothetical protein